MPLAVSVIVMYFCDPAAIFSLLALHHTSIPALFTGPVDPDASSYWRRVVGSDHQVTVCASRREKNDMYTVQVGR